MARCQSDMIGIKADGRITSIYFSCRNFLWNPHEIPLSRSLRLFPRFLPILTSIFGGKKVDRYRYRYEINPTVSHFYSNESIGFLWRSIDRSIDYAPERVKLAEGPFNSGKWLDRNNWSHPTDRCNLFDYRWSRWPMYKSAASFPLDAISLESEFIGSRFSPSVRIVGSSVQARFRAKGNVAWATTRDSFPLIIKERGEEDRRELLTERIGESWDGKLIPWSSFRIPFSRMKEKLSVDDSFHRLAEKDDSKQDDLLNVDSTRDRV